MFAWLRVLDAGSFNVAERSLADFNCVPQFDHISFRIRWEVAEGCSSIHLQKKPGDEGIFWELVMLLDSSSLLVL